MPTKSLLSDNNKSYLVEPSDISPVISSVEPKLGSPFNKQFQCIRYFSHCKILPVVSTLLTMPVNGQSI